MVRYICVGNVLSLNPSTYGDLHLMLYARTTGGAGGKNTTCRQPAHLYLLEAGNFPGLCGLGYLGDKNDFLLQLVLMVD